MRNVRFGSKADMCSAKRHVRFVPIRKLMHRNKKITRSRRRRWRASGTVSPRAFAVLKVHDKLVLGRRFDYPQKRTFGVRHDMCQRTFELQMHLNFTAAP